MIAIFIRSTLSYHVAELIRAERGFLLFPPLSNPKRLIELILIKNFQLSDTKENFLPVNVLIRSVFVWHVFASARALQQRERERQTDRQTDRI